ncbi:MAG TPA: DNA-binding protein [Acidimicrobiaceae bacterium]|nr:DNA-binding protein [Acidimicrobiaceae bacterium]
MILGCLYSLGCTTDETNLPRGIGAPATRALTAAGYSTLEQLNGVSATELKRLHGFGPRALRILEEALREHGYSLS